MLGKIVVGNGYGRGSMNDVNKPIIATSEETMVDPYIRRGKYINSISIGAPATARVGRAIPNNARAPGLAVVNANPMYNNVAHVRDCDARPVSYLHFGPSPIDGLVTIYHELVLKCDDHIFGEDDP